MFFSQSRFENALRTGFPEEALKIASEMSFDVSSHGKERHLFHTVFSPFMRPGYESSPVKKAVFPESLVELVEMFRSKGVFDSGKQNDGFLNTLLKNFGEALADGDRAPAPEDIGRIFKVIRILLDNGIDPNIPVNLFFPQQEGLVPIFEFLNAIENNNARTSYLGVEWRKRNMGIVRDLVSLLLDYGMKLSHKNHSGDTVAHMIVRPVRDGVTDDTDFLRMLYDRDPGILSYRNDIGETPVIAASRNQRSSEAIWMASVGRPEYLSVPKDGEHSQNTCLPALFYAAQNRDVELCRVLIQRKADVNETNASNSIGCPAFTCPAAFVDMKKIACIGGNVPQTDEESEKKYLEILEIMCANGLDINKCNMYGQPLLFHVLSRCARDGISETGRKIIRMLEERGATVPFTPSLLCTAIAYGNIEILERIFLHPEADARQKGVCFGLRGFLGNAPIYPLDALRGIYLTAQTRAEADNLFVKTFHYLIARDDVDVNAGFRGLPGIDVDSPVPLIEWVASKHYVEAAKTLLEHKAKIRAACLSVSECETTPISWILEKDAHIETGFWGGGTTWDTLEVFIPAILDECRGSYAYTKRVCVEITECIEKELVKGDALSVMEQLISEIAKIDHVAQAVVTSDDFTPSRG